MWTDDNFTYQVLNLTEKFYMDYPNPPYSEFVTKGARPYNCLLIQSRYGYFICIPYRSNVKHRYSYRFKNSERAKCKKSGLDYTKVVIVTDSDYIGTQDAVIDTDEYKETRENISKIIKDVQKYIDTYVSYILKTAGKLDEREFQRAYQYSTLKYFHKELGMEN